MLKSKLAAILERWEKEGGDLHEMLSGLDVRPIKRRSDARAICGALAHVELTPPGEEGGGFSQLDSLLALVQDVQSLAAFKKITADGMPHLRQMIREGLATSGERDGDELVHLLKVLAQFGNPDDAEFILEAARLHLDPENYAWSLVFRLIDSEHPAWPIIWDELRNPLPEGFTAIAFLDFANELAVLQGLEDHPFASPEGRARLEAYLTDENEEHFSYALSATTALPFLEEASRTPLLELAANHLDPEVRLESAWVGARMGDDEGVPQLRRWCLDLNLSRRACALMKEVGHEDDIPGECLEPDFMATAEMCAWLAHEQEFGHPPDKIELHDTRWLYWPPTNDERQVWLFNYIYLPADDEAPPRVGIGMVGSVTTSLFFEAAEPVTVEDVYGLHCSLELSWSGDSRVPGLPSAATGRAILAARNSGF